MDRFYDMLEAKYKQDSGLKVIEWKEWGNMRDILHEKIRKIMKLCPLLITSHSIRISAMGKDSGSITYQAMDVPSGVQKWIQGATDANLHFYWDKDQNDKGFPAFSVHNRGITEESMAGSRDENMYNMHTLDELRQYIYAQFSVEDKLKLAA